MNNSDNGIAKQLRAVVEEDKEIIRKLREEVDRLRFLLGLHSLKNQSDSASVLPPHSRNRQKLHPDYSN